ncbi:AAA family ATPase [Nocardioides sp. LMS-CY]|uniref:AAA family ATPase n=1 Tax=Nocardioides sp. (strain LMS-CY) TaxID=2840457 RepID=UPI001C001715|nr:AAA family ATPase [Nocardioides sp. LMS-CY]QWF20280.1 AAA family ATPase [Nocardioides sp. LMS-CY]
MDFDQPPVVRVDVESSLSRDTWPMTIPAVAQLAREGLELSPVVTFLVGENGSGKSTIVEAVAAAYGLSPEGGSAQGHHSTRVSESPLGDALRLQRGLGAPRWGFFLRAETMHGWYTFYEDAGQSLPPGAPRGPRYHEMSHGESFLEVLRTRFDSPGFYCLDEPEAALSFSSTLALIGALGRVVESGGQVLCATHSPVLAAMPGATILEVGDWGVRRTTWQELELVEHWRAYLEAPQRYLRHVLD